MAGLKQIKRRLVSVKSTRQITRAMKLVSAAKLNRAQDAANKAREYSDALTGLMSEILQTVSLDDIQHPLMQAREQVKTVRVIVVGGMRGLCGSFNANLNKAVDAWMKERKGANLQIESVIIGKKPAEYYRRVGLQYTKSYETLPDDPNKWPIDDVCDELAQDFIAGKFDEAVLIFTKFKSVMSQKPTVERLLPFSLDAAPAAGEGASATTIFEPSAAELFSQLIPRLMRVKVRQAGLEARASELASRMTAMDAATKNAGELIDGLRLTYNRLRQSGITKELLDILGGAEAAAS